MIKLILQIHKRNYHKGVNDIKNILQKIGVPLRVLTLVATAIALCTECRQFMKYGTTPHVSTGVSTIFNKHVYADILFFDDTMWLIILDAATRFVMVFHVD